MNPLHISDIFIYPIKSLAGISANESKVESRGLQYDRRWVLVNDDNVFVHQRDHHEMVFLQPEITGDKIQVTHKQDPGLSVQIPITPESSTRELVTVWADQCPAVEVSKEVSTWFSSVMGFPCRLMHMPDDSVRPTDPDFSVNQDDKVSFADGYPLLAISEASMRLLNEKTEEYMSSSRFRANIIIKGGHPHIEDELGVFEINEITFYGVKPLYQMCNDHSGSRNL